MISLPFISGNIIRKISRERGAFTLWIWISQNLLIISKIWLIKIAKKKYCKSVKFHWLRQWKLTDITVKIFFPLIQLVIINWFSSEIYFLTGESVKRQITDSINKNLTDSDLESTFKNERLVLFGRCFIAINRSLFQQEVLFSKRVDLGNEIWRQVYPRVPARVTDPPESPSLATTCPSGSAKMYTLFSVLLLTRQSGNGSYLFDIEQQRPTRHLTLQEVELIWNPIAIPTTLLTNEKDEQRSLVQRSANSKSGFQSFS